MVSLSNNLSLVTATPVVVVAGKGRIHYTPSQAHLCENGCTGRRTIVLFGKFVGTTKTNVSWVNCCLVLATWYLLHVHVPRYRLLRCGSTFFVFFVYFRQSILMLAESGIYDMRAGFYIFFPKHLTGLGHNIAVPTSPV